MAEETTDAGGASIYPQDPDSGSDSEAAPGGNGGRELEWHRVLAEDELPEGRVTTAHAGLKEIALVHYEGRWAALDNRCPHQGGPLGEGSIENGLLRCPWHGFDYDPLTGGSPGEFVDTASCFPIDLRPRLDRIRLSGGDRGMGSDGAKRPILAVTGDGGFGQYMAEQTTAVRHDINITHVLVNNGQLGKISKEQRAGAWDVWQTQLTNPDFSKYAENCGALGIRVTDRSRLDDALTQALAHHGPAMVEVMADGELV